MIVIGCQDGVVISVTAKLETVANSLGASLRPFATIRDLSAGRSIHSAVNMRRGSP